MAHITGDYIYCQSQENANQDLAQSSSHVEQFLPKCLSSRNKTGADYCSCSGGAEGFDFFLQHLSQLMVGFLVGDLVLPPVLASGLKILSVQLTHTQTLVWGNVDNISASCKGMATLAHMDCSCAKGLEPSHHGSVLILILTFSFLNLIRTFLCNTNVMENQL